MTTKVGQVTTTIGLPEASSNMIKMPWLLLERFPRSYFEVPTIKLYYVLLK